MQDVTYLFRQTDIIYQGDFNNTEIVQSTADSIDVLKSIFSESFNDKSRLPVFFATFDLMGNPVIQKKI